MQAGNKRILIVGGGPIGLEAACYARSLGHDCVIFERGDLAESVGKWGFVSLFSPWEMNATPLGWRTIGRAIPGGKICPTGVELREKYLLPLAESSLLRGCIQTHTAVISIGRDDPPTSDAMAQAERARSPFRVLVRDARGKERIEKADVVLDCSGVYHHHRWAGRGGIPAPGERALESRIFYHLPDVLSRDRAAFVGKHTLVMGAGYSAATMLQMLGQLHRQDPRTKASWAIRRVGQALQSIHDDPLPARCALVSASLKLANHPPDWLQYLGNCVLEKIDGEKQLAVTLRYMETDLLLVVDEVAALVGYAPDNSIEEELQLQQAYPAGAFMRSPAAAGEGSADAMTTAAHRRAESFSNSEPNFFILGAKSYGTNSNFLLQAGHRQLRDAFAIIQGDRSLDLYAAPR